MTKRDLAGDDSGAQLAFLYQEAVRGLAHQQYVVESLNTRAGNLIFATAFATSLLGTRRSATGSRSGTGSRSPCCCRIRIALQVSLLLLILEIVAWLLSIGGF